MSSGPPDRSGKLASLRSSAALVANVFDPWRGHNLTPLAAALGSEAEPDRLRLEAQYPTGLAGTPPHLDVVLDGPVERTLAIESKFTEPYGSPPSNQFRPSYFDRPIWTGLPTVEELARRIHRSDEKFESLHAAQLIKHTIGLARALGPKGFELIYLWYRWPSDRAELHENEIDLFASYAVADIGFRSLTYQALMEQLAAGGVEPAEGYLEYWRSRYQAS